MVKEVILDIKQWGNNLVCACLPLLCVKRGFMSINGFVCLSMITRFSLPRYWEPLSLEQRLAQFDPARHGGEVMSSEQPLGAEKW